MSDAANTPVKRQYNRSHHTEDTPLTQQSNVDLSLDAKIVHGEALAQVSGDTHLNGGLLADLAFNEEPVTILIENNSNSDNPETHVPVQVNGRGAEVLSNGKWLEITWLPIGVELTTRRKFVEVLARSKSTTIRTQHEDANVERPRNEIKRFTKAQYPMSILVDDNPRGRAWLASIRTEH